ncbi:hypothetical protein HDU78_005067 [Chytriomyces hyalinus]|nr:hypothetical protein HDU78_005067 [Chytriomyces hyalinus]
MIHTCYLATSQRDSALSKALAQLPADLAVRIVYTDATTNNLIHCTPYPGTGVCLIPAADVASKPADDESFVSLYCALMDKTNAIVLVETQEGKLWAEFTRFQAVGGLEFGLKVVPVDSMEHGARMIARMIHQETRPSKPAALVGAASGKTENQNTLQIKSVCGIPGIGEQKARDLLKEFSTLRGLGDASEAAIAERVKGMGRVQAKKVVAFFENEKSLHFMA